MKKLVSFLVVLHLLFMSFTVSAELNENLIEDEIFMENVYNFILSPDLVDIVYIQDDENLKYCAEVYLEATRRRDYTQEEINICWDYFDKKNAEEIAYKKYMLNNRELFN